jgi:hypothetical protein
MWSPNIQILLIDYRVIPFRESFPDPCLEPVCAPKPPLCTGGKTKPAALAMQGCGLGEDEMKGCKASI